MFQILFIAMMPRELFGSGSEGPGSTKPWRSHLKVLPRRSTVGTEGTQQFL